MRRYGVILALLAVAAAGCSKERAGALPSAPVTSATPVASRTADLSAQVEAAARAYYAYLEHAGRTGDVSPLRAVVDPACECFQQVAAVERETAAGRHLTTHYVVDAVQAHDVTATTGYATVTLTYAASTVVDANGRVVRTLRGETRAGRDLQFRKEGSAWLLTRLVLLG